MQCPNDKIEMIKGALGNGVWLDTPVNKIPWLIRGFRPITVKNIWLVAWRCPKCGKVELYTEEPKQPEQNQ